MFEYEKDLCENKKVNKLAKLLKLLKKMRKPGTLGLKKFETGKL